jgi:hypothetical protein
MSVLNNKNDAAFCIPPTKSLTLRCSICHISVTDLLLILGLTMCKSSVRVPQSLRLLIRRLFSKICNTGPPSPIRALIISASLLLLSKDHAVK